jgi:hypothetical protein
MKTLGLLIRITHRILLLIWAAFEIVETIKNGASSRNQECRYLPIQ